MKYTFLILGTALASMLAGCSTTPPLALAPVGPGPAGRETEAAGTGKLEVFSALVGRSEGDNPTWYQHSGYYLCDSNGKQKQLIGNTIGRYAKAPRIISLASGNYLIEARASDYQWVKVPVVIKPGDTTIVHLDDGWKPADIPSRDIVSLPNGDAVGWSGNLGTSGNTL